MMRIIFALLLGLAASGAARAADAPRRYDLSLTDNKAFLAEIAARPGFVKLPDGVMYRVIQSGMGAAPADSRDKVTVAYKGYLIDGEVFDQTKPDSPATLLVGRVIPGWKEILRLMKEGDQWEVVIPAEQGYGEGGGMGVSSDQTLIFTMKLLKVEHYD